MLRIRVLSIRCFGGGLLLALLALVSSCAAQHKPAEATQAKAAPEMGKVMVARIYVKSDYKRIWRELTSTVGYSWFSAPAACFEAKVGGRLVFGSLENPLISGTLLSIKEGEGFMHTFAFAWAPEEQSTVTWQVVQEGEVVRIEVSHDASAAPQAVEIIGDWGWQKSLSRLKSLVETGTLMPWPDDAPKETPKDGGENSSKK